MLVRLGCEGGGEGILGDGRGRRERERERERALHEAPPFWMAVERTRAIRMKPKPPPNPEISSGA